MSTQKHRSAFLRSNAAKNVCPSDVGRRRTLERETPCGQLRKDHHIDLPVHIISREKSHLLIEEIRPNRAFLHIRAHIAGRVRESVFYINLPKKLMGHGLCVPLGTSTCVKTYTPIASQTPMIHGLNILKSMEPWASMGLIYLPMSCHVLF